MLNETYLEMKHNLDFIKEQQNKCKKVQRLLKNESVKEFISNANMDYKTIKAGYKVYTNEEVLNKLIINTLRQIRYDDTNKIYVYINSYKVINGNIYYFIDDTLGIDFVTYHNLEQEDEIIIPYHQVKEFEHSNIILRNKTNLDNQVFYEKVRLEYFKYLLKYSQKESNKLILNKYRRR